MSSNLANVTLHHKLQMGSQWFIPLRYTYIMKEKHPPCKSAHPDTIATIGMHYRPPPRIVRSGQYSDQLELLSCSGNSRICGEG